MCAGGEWGGEAAVSEDPVFEERLEAVKERLEALDREEDMDQAVSLLEDAVALVEGLGSELEEEK